MYRDALQTAAIDKDRLTSRHDSELATYRARVRQLESEVIQYRRAVATQREKLDRHLQLATLLQSPSTTRVRLRAAEAGNNSYRVALISANSDVVFYPSNFPAPA